jgi:hypothetical protein
MILSDLDKLRLESAVDESLRQALVADPAAVLKERGIDVPEGVTVSVVEDGVDSYTLTLPAYVGSDLSSDALTASASSDGTWWCTTCTATSPICAGSLASLTCLGSK